MKQHAKPPRMQPKRVLERAPQIVHHNMWQPLADLAVEEESAGLETEEEKVEALAEGFSKVSMQVAEDAGVLKDPAVRKRGRLLSLSRKCRRLIERRRALYKRWQRERDPIVKEQLRVRHQGCSEQTREAVRRERKVASIRPTRPKSTMAMRPPGSTNRFPGWGSAW